MKLWNLKGEQNSFAEALQLQIPEHAVISIAGAGGKTSLLLAWASELAASGRRTVVTTTTHMAKPGCLVKGSDPYAGISVIYTGRPEAASEAALMSQAGSSLCSDAPVRHSCSDLLSSIDKLLDEDGPVMVVSPDPVRPGKVAAPSDDILDYLYQAADVVLIEADGSRGLPLKWPAPWEPVIPECTDITICVTGLTSLGRPVSEVMYRAEYIPEEYLQVLRRRQSGGRGAEEPACILTVDEYFISSVIASLDGGRKGVRGEFRAFLNQSDTQKLLDSASLIQQILSVQGIQCAWGRLGRERNTPGITG